MNVDLRPDDQDFTTGEFPHLDERIIVDRKTHTTTTEYGIVFGNHETTVTLWYRTQGERQMMLQTAELLVQR